MRVLQSLEDLAVGKTSEVLIPASGDSSMLLTSGDKMENVDLKKYIAELIGTLVLVLFGCGVAVVVGCSEAMASHGS